MNTNPLGRMTFTPRCERKHCDAAATHSLVVRIPAKGCPTKEHDPLIADPNVRLCSHHTKTANVGEFLPAPLKRKIKAVCHERRVAPPDFSRAFLERKPLPSTP